VEQARGALAMGVGDVLIRWSNRQQTQKYTAPPHSDDVVSRYPTSNIHCVHLAPLQDQYIRQERMTGERYPIPYFVNPKRITVMKWVLDCFSPDNPLYMSPRLYSDEMGSGLFQS